MHESKIAVIAPFSVHRATKLVPLDPGFLVHILWKTVAADAAAKCNLTMRVISGKKHCPCAVAGFSHCVGGLEGQRQIMESRKMSRIPKLARMK